MRALTLSFYKSGSLSLNGNVKPIELFVIIVAKSCVERQAGEIDVSRNQ